MKTVWAGLLFFMACTLSAGKAKEPQVKAAYDLIERVTPGYGDQFVLELTEKVDGKDAYEIGARKGKVLLRGNNAVSIATAYNMYLKYTCGAHVSWLGDQLDLPERLPLPDSTVCGTINGKFRVYMNYCTISYSAAWWDWDRWQREIDFMAMNSVNMPMSVIGLEAVWYNVLLKYGFSDPEARGFLAGPAHFAWQWMQNIQSYGGPLPKSWIDKHVILGRQILERELELGMTPIQQGFSGYVPRELKEKYPDARIRLQDSWCGFNGAAQLDPTDPLFLEMGRDFLEEEKRLYGTYGFYAADPFHESSPPVDTPEYLAAVGETINRLFKDFDPESVWVMQAWSLREQIVKSVPMDELLILDLGGETYKGYDGFWGYPFITGNLHSFFGARINMHGDLRLLASNQYMDAADKYDNVCGSGLFMEGIEQNPVYYDLAFDMPVHDGDVDIETWLGKYAERRYGHDSKAAAKAWELLLEGPYRPGTNGTERSSIIAARPALDVKKSGPNAGLGIPYDPRLAVEAAGLLLEDSDVLGSSDGYRFDIMDVHRQMLSNLGQFIHKKAAEAFRKGDKEAFAIHSGRFLELLRDVDMLLRTRSEFNFDRWLVQARSWGDTGKEKDLFERDATSLVTIWGGDGDPLIFDYSWREWAGLIDGFYLKRWEKFYGMLADCLETGIHYSEEGLPQTHGREAFRANPFYSSLGDWELEYVDTPEKARTPVTQGDEIETARGLYSKYLPLVDEYMPAGTDASVPQEGDTYENLEEQN